MFELATRFQTPIAELSYMFTLEEWILWQIYLSEPRDDRRNDWHAALITQAIYSIIPALAGKRKKTKTKDFLLKFNPAGKKSQSPKEAAEVLNRIFGNIIPEEKTKDA